MLDCMKKPVRSFGPNEHPAAPDLVSVDFETYYDADTDIATLGSYGYVDHPKAFAYLVAIYAFNGELTYVGPVEDAPWEKINGLPWWSHNAAFDMHVFEVAQKRNQIPAYIQPRSWDCTADLSVYHHAPRNLSGAARELLGATLEKETRDLMKGKTYDDAIRLGLKDQLHRYALDGDGKHCYLLAQKFGPSWPESEIRMSRLNRKAGSRGVHVNTPALELNIKSLQHAIWKAGSDIPWEWGGPKQNKTPLSLEKARAQCRAEGIPAPTTFKEDSPECDAWEAKYAADHKWIHAIRAWRKANMLLKKLETVKVRTRADGTFPYMIKYFGAHTGRFSGSDRFNMQNMAREPMDLSLVLGDEAPNLPRSVDLRNMFVAAPGRDMLINDLAQIEARNLLYMVGDWKQLALIAKGMDVYEAHARVYLNYDLPIPLAVAAKKDPVYNNIRKLAKARVLGLGYGCGTGKFKEVALIMGGLTLTSDECKVTVAQFREDNPGIVALWRHLHQLLRMAALRKEHLRLVLPSGRKLVYFNPHFDLGDIKAQVEMGGAFYKFYGGKLTENCLLRGSRVLTDSGWKAIENVERGDKIHDGVDFVSHGGVVSKSVQPCVTVDGVGMTADHEVLTHEGWTPASHQPQPYRPSIWELDSDAPDGERREKNALGVSMYLRELGREDGDGCHQGSEARWDAKLWMPYSTAYWAKQSLARNVEASGLRGMAQHDRPLSASLSCRLEELRWARHPGVLAMVELFHKLLGRCGVNVPNRIDVRPHGQQQGVLAKELPLGDAQTERAQYPSRKDSRLGAGCSRCQRSQAYHTALQSGQRMASGTSGEVAAGLPQPVYDILNCGPRHRFVVMGASGPFIVHNCIQAMSRDIFVHGLLEAEADGVADLAFHAHDEGIWNGDGGEDCLHALDVCMTRAPAWAPDFPLGTSGHVTQFYFKD